MCLMLFTQIEIIPVALTFPQSPVIINYLFLTQSMTWHTWVHSVQLVSYFAFESF